MSRGSIDIDAQLDRMEAEGAIAVDSVDFGVPDATAVRRELGSTLDYFARVEREVERNVLELQVLLPQADDRTRRFMRVWEEQELPHGWIFDRLQRELGLPESTPNLNHISRSLRLGGVLGHVPGVHDALMFLYFSIGAMHERLTAVGYDLLKERLLHLGARGFAETAVAPIRGQESTHYAYYRNSALLQRERLADWQLHLCRIVRTRTYHPIGATTPSNRADFGGVAVHLSGSDDVDRFAVPVQRVAQELLVRQRDGLRLPAFVARGLRESVAAFRARESGHRPDRDEDLDGLVPA
ncbi:GTP-binding protein LepA [Aquipuribacter nitratireducens]|uniref:GTP-binding protein LepA n=1 Tax=Aquipuribacter nitratireducens TaxID=650104 RepID=A0ABW0GPU4_9MICO